jgi:hypothetical protein
MWERLEARRSEIDRAVFTRIRAISDHMEVADPEYAHGLRAAVSAAVAYGLAAVELGEEHSPPPPPILLAQARLAARNGIGLDTVLRRYFAGHALIGDYLIEEAERGGIKGAALQRLLRTQAALFDRLLAAISEEHAREVDSRTSTSAQRHTQRVERLLAGELLEAPGLAYDFTGSHLGAIAVGPDAAKALGDLAGALDRNLMLVDRDQNTVWAWLGSRRSVDPAEIERFVISNWPSQISLAIGEPGDGLAGWRLTHHQARAALSIAVRGSRSFVRYVDVALLASILQDDLVATSLRALYLAPLRQERDGGETARQTLRAYFAAGRNVTSAAAALGVSRQAVNSRLRMVEKRIGRHLEDCATDLEAALRME